MPNKMSARKTKIANRLASLGMVFDGQKIKGRYLINNVSFCTLDEIDEYIKLIVSIHVELKVAA